MGLFDLLHGLDLKILYFANRQIATPWDDILFKIWSSPAPWLMIAAILLTKTAYGRQWSEIKTILWLAATVGFTDAFAAQMIKPFLGRLRPCKIENFIRIVDGCAGSLSFPSNHAANGAAFTVFWLLWYGPKKALPAIGAVLMVGFSRLYLGMHYPTDVLGGFAFGGLIGALSFGLFQALGLDKDAKKGAEAPSLP